MTIRLEGIGMNPNIEVEANRLHNGKVQYVEIKIGELVLELSERDADYLRSQIDKELHEETRESLESKIDELQEIIDKKEVA